jgi:hypothetical protein
VFRRCASAHAVEFGYEQPSIVVAQAAGDSGGAVPMISVGDHGDEVGQLHQLLLERGHSLAQDEIANATFGPTTRVVVLIEQNKAGLTADGIVGPKTLAALRRPPGIAEKFTQPGWRCEPSTIRAEVKPVVDAAVADLARPTFEEPPGSNVGALLAKYGNHGLPWCAYAVSHWFSHADDKPLKGVPLASAYKWREWARMSGRLLGDSDRVEPGDVGIVVRPSGNGHVGLIVWVSPDGKTLCSIEGNVKNSVQGVVRPRSAWGHIARPIPLR